MNNFIAKAFVKIQTKERRESVLDSLRKGRIRLEGNKKYLDCDYLFFTKNKYGIMQKHDIKSQSKTSIDCNFYANGDEDLAVDLFLALAEMQDNPLRDWNVSVKGGLFNPQKSWVSGKSRLATPLELAEAVRSGAITKEQLCK